MKKLIFLFIMFPALVLADEFLLVKEVWGKVNLTYSNKKKESLKIYFKLEEDQSIELVDESSKVWIRDHNNNNLIIEFDEKNHYSFQDLIAMVSNNQLKNSSKKTFSNKFFSLISLPNYEQSTKINDMIISPKTGVSRNSNLNIVKLNKLFIIKGISFTFDFSNLMSNTYSKDYNIKIKDRGSKQILYDFVTDKKSFEFDVAENPNSLVINWSLEIANPQSPKTLVVDLSSLYLNPKSQDLFNELLDKAMVEVGNDKCFYQIILLEFLISKALYLNARYYLDYFMINNKKAHLTKYQQILQN